MDFGHHAADGRIVRPLDGVPNPAQTERAQGVALVLRSTDRATHLRDPQLSAGVRRRLLVLDLDSIAHGVSPRRPRPEPPRPRFRSRSWKPPGFAAGNGA